MRNEFGIKMQPNFIDVNKEQISVYFPEHENIWCADTFIIVKAPKYRVRISYNINGYVGELYDSRIEQDIEVREYTHPEFTDKELDPLVARVVVDKLDQFRDLLTQLLYKITTIDGLLKNGLLKKEIYLQW